jgi:hypothetical protein
VSVILCKQPSPVFTAGGKKSGSSVSLLSIAAGSQRQCFPHRGPFSQPLICGTEKMSQPLVSVAMVVCNVDRFLREAIESILAQTLRDFEFIIVDFGSTDNSKSIISKYAAIDSRIRFYEIPHCGLAEARNAACFRAQGKYIAIVDADDVSLPNRLFWELEFMESHPEVGVVGGAVECIDAAGRVLITWGNPTTDREIRSALLERCPFWQPTVLMRRDAFAGVGGYRGPFAPAEDYDLWLRISERFRVANLERTVLKYRIHPNQVSVRKVAQQSLGILAAQLAASSRRDRLPDPLTSVEEITPKSLAELGVSKAEQQNHLASYATHWIRTVCMTREYSAALNVAREILRSEVEHVERWQVANLWLVAARLCWKQRRFAEACLSAARAVVTRPNVVGRPIKPLLRSVRLLRAR